MGIARLALAGLAVLLLLALLVIGGRALFVSLATPEPAAPTSGAPTSGASASASSTGPPASGARPATVAIECVAVTCPLVLVRVPGGDVLQSRDMSQDEVVTFFEPKLDVVIEDGSTVRVTENGVARPQGEPGQKESFTAQAPQD